MPNIINLSMKYLKWILTLLNLKRKKKHNYINNLKKKYLWNKKQKIVEKLNHKGDSINNKKEMQN